MIIIAINNIINKRNFDIEINILWDKFVPASAVIQSYKNKLY